MLSRLLLIALLTLSFSACYPEFAHPLSDPTLAKADDRLLGVWTLKKDHSQGYMHISKTIEGSSEIALIGYEKDGSIDISKYKMFPTFIGNDSYMNLQAIDDKEVQKSYYLAKYQFTPDGQLKISLLDEDRLKVAIDKGQLSSETRDKNFGSRLINNDSAAVAQFLSEHQQDDLFVKYGKFQKVAN